MSYSNLSTIHLKFLSNDVCLELYYAFLLSFFSPLQKTTKHVPVCRCYSCNNHHRFYYSGHGSKENQSSLALQNDHLLPSVHSRCDFLEILIFLKYGGSIFPLQCIILNAPNSSQHISPFNLLPKGKQKCVNRNICNNYCERDREGAMTLQRTGEREMDLTIFPERQLIGCLCYCASYPLTQVLYSAVEFSALSYRKLWYFVAF